MSERLKNKEDLVIRCINIIIRQLKLDIKIFDEVKNIKSSLPQNKKNINSSKNYNYILYYITNNKFYK